MDALFALIKFFLFLFLVLALVVLAIPLLIVNLFFKGFLAAFFRTLARFYAWCYRKRRREGPRADAVTVSPPPYSRKKSENVTLIRE